MGGFSLPRRARVLALPVLLLAALACVMPRPVVADPPSYGGIVLRGDSRAKVVFQPTYGDSPLRARVR